MMDLKTAVIASMTVTGLVTGAVASPGAFVPPAPPSVRIMPVGNGYGPIPDGLYGNRHRFRAKRSYGTGYHGRGTKTGGPAGGLPGRS